MITFMRKANNNASVKTTCIILLAFLSIFSFAQDQPATAKLIAERDVLTEQRVAIRGVETSLHLLPAQFLQAKPTVKNNAELPAQPKAIPVMEINPPFLSAKNSMVNDCVKPKPILPSKKQRVESQITNCKQPLVAFVPAYSSERVRQLSWAIGRAEGFGVRGAKPTRLNNPGDVRALSSVRYPGQVRLERQGYVVFKTQAHGWAALQANIICIIEGKSKHYTLETTINQMAKRYAVRWQPWAHNVAKSLNVSGATTLGDYLTNGYLDVPPVIPATVVVKSNVSLLESGSRDAVDNLHQTAPHNFIPCYVNHQKPHFSCKESGISARIENQSADDTHIFIPATVALLSNPSVQEPGSQTSDENHETSAAHNFVSQSAAVIHKPLADKPGHFGLDIHAVLAGQISEER